MPEKLSQTHAQVLEHNLNMSFNTYKLVIQEVTYEGNEPIEIKLAKLQTLALCNLGMTLQAIAEMLLFTTERSKLLTADSEEIKNAASLRS
jgi:hypothetical protein